MASYQNDEEQSLIINVEEQSYNVNKAKSKMALFAGVNLFTFIDFYDNI
jgi:hypothetical protein